MSLDQIAELKGIPTKADLLKLLSESTQIVTFQKLNGDERIMTCTKDLNIIPKENHPKATEKAHETNITVWDTNAKGWRSFVYDRVRKVEVNG